MDASENAESNGEVPSATAKISAEKIVPDESLDRLTNSEAIEWLAAPPALVQCAKHASEILFALTADRFENAPLSKLFTDRFDAEQIWQQIDLQSHPILSFIRRKLKNLEKSSNHKFFTGLEVDEADVVNNGETHDEEANKQSGSRNEESPEDVLEEDIEDSDSETASGDEEVEKRGEDEDDDENEEDEEGEDEGARQKTAIQEDDFFRIGEMEKFLDKTDAEGIFGTGEEDASGSPVGDDDDVDSDAETSEEDEEGDKSLGFGRYEDFFANGKAKRKTKQSKDSNSQESADEFSEDDEGTAPAQPESKSSEGEKLSAHERRQKKIEERMKQLEKASLDPKDWTKQGEVSAKRRPKNSALEVELDFEHNVRPPPVITEEVTTSLEDMIRARIAEEKFDDVQRKPIAADNAPRERIELDESKSKRGLGEIYEAEYMQKSGMAAAPTSTSEALKEEATELFRALCHRLDALSHFHFAPKPVIDDMEVQADVPALAMEEVAPLAVSEASLLAPEEIFAGEIAVKGESELTPEERKRRRAQKKRKRKGAKEAQGVDRMQKRIRATRADPVVKQSLKLGQSAYSKSSKVFAELHREKNATGKPAPKKNHVLGNDKHAANKNNLERPQQASFLKL